MGAYRVIDLEQFPVRISTDTTDKIWDFFFILSFFLSLYSLVRFMAFQSVSVVTTPAFTIMINSNKRSLLGQYIAAIL